MNAQLNLMLARKAGLEKEYTYHLGAVENPLPFEVWKRKSHLLDSLLNQDPDGKCRSLDSKIHSLSVELGV